MAEAKANALWKQKWPVAVEVSREAEVGVDVAVQV